MFNLTRSPRGNCGGRIVIVLLAAILGCHSQEEAHDEHHSHHRKPHNYTAAVERLTELHTAITRGESHHHSDDHGDDHDDDHGDDHGDDHDDHGHHHDDGHDDHDEHEHDHEDDYEKSLDIARWLPDLAADSDLEESEWNRVNKTANKLAAILVQVCSREGDARRKAYLEQESKIEGYHRELAKCKQLINPDTSPKQQTIESQ